MTPFHSILVALDFSTDADAALDLAIDVARRDGASLALYHAYEIPLGAIPPYGVPIPDSLVASVRDAAARRLAEAVRKVEGAGLKAETHLVQAAPPSEGIVDAAQSSGADLIVLGTRGLTGLKHVLIGSVAERTVRLAHCPVLTVHAAEAGKKPHTGRFGKIFVAVDFSAHSEAALDLAIAVAKAHGGALNVIHAYDLPASVTTAYAVPLPQSVWEGVQAAAAKRVEEALARATAAGVRAVPHLVMGPAADAIVSTAEAQGAELIVLGTRGLTGVKHVILGSVAERVLRTAPCPVLTTKSEG